MTETAGDRSVGRHRKYADAPPATSDLGPSVLQSFVTKAHCVFPT